MTRQRHHEGATVRHDEPGRLSSCSHLAVVQTTVSVEFSTCQWPVPLSVLKQQNGVSTYFQPSSSPYHFQCRKRHNIFQSFASLSTNSKDTVKLPAARSCEHACVVQKERLVCAASDRHGLLESSPR